MAGALCKKLTGMKGLDAVLWCPVLYLLPEEGWSQFHSRKYEFFSHHCYWGSWLGRMFACFSWGRRKWEVVHHHWHILSALLCPRWPPYKEHSAYILRRGQPSHSLLGPRQPQEDAAPIHPKFEIVQSKRWKTEPCDVLFFSMKHGTGYLLMSTNSL